MSLIVNPPDQQIVINEIHYDPDENNIPEEFIELFNAGTTTVNLSGWYFSDGIEYTIPAGVALGAGQYLLIAENPAVIQSRYGVAALGPWSGSLNNEGEEVVLRNGLGNRVDQVDYNVGFPWPLASEGTGSSMELIHPGLDNDLGGSWRASQESGESRPPVTLLGADGGELAVSQGDQRGVQPDQRLAAAGVRRGRVVAHRADEHRLRRRGRPDHADRHAKRLHFGLFAKRIRDSGGPASQRTVAARVP